MRSRFAIRQEQSELPAASKLRAVFAPPRIKKSDARDVDRSAEFRWLIENGASYQGQWVALLGNELVCHARSLKELLATLKDIDIDGKTLVHHIV
ncbi:MAG TPA: hypothetical protein VMW27_25365 [Thermoanaerobaculia bacterium]|nr:hypothetical protein [Thermoanaerobaculia bacterium]